MDLVVSSTVEAAVNKIAQRIVSVYIWLAYLQRTISSDNKDYFISSMPLLLHFLRKLKFFLKNDIFINLRNLFPDPLAISDRGKCGSE